MSLAERIQDVVESVQHCDPEEDVASGPAPFWDLFNELWDLVLWTFCERLDQNFYGGWLKQTSRKHGMRKKKELAKDVSVIQCLREKLVANFCCVFFVAQQLEQDGVCLPQHAHNRFLTQRRGMTLAPPA